MKRIILFLALLFLLLSLAACATPKPDAPAEDLPSGEGDDVSPGDELPPDVKTESERGFIYRVNDDDSRTLIGVEKYAQSELYYILHAQLRSGKRLAGIDKNAFEKCTSLTGLYFDGSAEELAAISLPTGGVPIYSYAETQPAEEGNFWHYKASRPTVWHYHKFDREIKSDRYLASPVACGEAILYYRSCACGECGNTTFAGGIREHSYGVVASDSGVIEKVYCTREECGHMEKLNYKLPTVGKYYGCFDCSMGDSDNDYSMIDSAKIFYYEKCKEADYNAYVAALKADGCVEKATYKMGKNLYTLLSNEAFTAYVSYLSGEGGLRVYIGRSDDVNPSKIRPKDAGVVKPALWQIDVNCQAAKANGGMSYVMQLTDGKFLVVDGGYRTEEDAKSIYDILLANKPVSHEKPIIAGWFFTHMHIDHVGAFRIFAERYRDDVVVEGFYYNFLYTNVGDIWPNNSRNWENAMRTSFPSATLYRKLHSGEQFFFSGAKVTIICTCEDNYPWENRKDDAPASHFKSGNDTSLVFKVEAGGQSVLFLGDAEYGESDRMMYLDDEVVHADILQYAHHGYDHQCRNEFYKKVNPTVVLWPMTLVNWESDSHGEVFRWRYLDRKENAWARSATSVKKIIVMAEGTTKLELPYTPTGARNADYVALYNEQRPKN